MKQVRPELETCPICGSRQMHIHCYYGRSIIDFIGGRPLKDVLCVLRLKCDCCSHTHSLLPDIIIPYQSHSLFFILRVIAEYLIGHFTIRQLCERFQISEKSLYSWLKLWTDHKAVWLGVLDDQCISSFSFLKSLLASDRYSDFACDFLMLTRFSFLQSHVNPRLADPKAADYCQHVFEPDYLFSLTT